ncbi:hypothetical protein FQA47_007837, partial [Oryzias melastigma]
MSMARLCLPVYTALLVGCFHSAVTDNDVTPRLSFPYTTFTSEDGGHDYEMFRDCRKPPSQILVGVGLAPKASKLLQITDTACKTAEVIRKAD